MQFDQEIIGDIHIIRIKQKIITSHEAPDVKTAFLRLIDGEGENFIVNMKELERMDSTGLGALLFGIRQANRYDKDICFCEISPKIKFLIHIAHLNDVIDIYDSEADALADFEEDDFDD